jgi:hypothetical protein
MPSPDNEKTTQIVIFLKCGKNIVLSMQSTLEETIETILRVKDTIRKKKEYLIIGSDNDECFSRTEDVSAIMIKHKFGKVIAEATEKAEKQGEQTGETSKRESVQSITTDICEVEEANVVVFPETTEENIDSTEEFEDSVVKLKDISAEQEMEVDEDKELEIETADAVVEVDETTCEETTSDKVTVEEQTEPVDVVVERNFDSGSQTDNSDTPESQEDNPVENSPTQEALPEFSIQEDI